MKREERKMQDNPLNGNGTLDRPEILYLLPPWAIRHTRYCARFNEGVSEINAPRCRPSKFGAVNYDHRPPGNTAIRLNLVTVTDVFPPFHPVKEKDKLATKKELKYG